MEESPALRRATPDIFDASVDRRQVMRELNLVGSECKLRPIVPSRARANQSGAVALGLYASGTIERPGNRLSGGALFAQAEAS